MLQWVVCVNKFKLKLLAVTLIILVSACKKDEQVDDSLNNNCIKHQSNPNWNTENFKSDFTIQFPNNYEGGIIPGFEGSTFFKQRTDSVISMEYGFCSPLFCYEFGDSLNQPYPSSISTTYNSQQMILDKSIIFCINDTIKGIFYYKENPNTIGKLYILRINMFREALIVKYELREQNEVENILRTIKTKPPKLSYSDTSFGCSNIIVYKFDNNNKESIVVNASKDTLNLDTLNKVFDIEQTSSGLSVYVELFSQNVADIYYCNDVVNTIQAKDIWTAKKGKINIVISKKNTVINETYKTTVKLEHIYFYNNNNDSIYLDSLNFTNVTVGWLPG